MREVQHLLHLPTDGAFGPQTRRGVVHFQQSRHLAGTGVVNRRTWVLLRHPGVQPSHSRARFWSGFHEGMSGPIIRQIQHLLGVHPDGEYGPVTADAVARFQRSHHLAATGEVNHLTLVLLRHPGPHHARHHRSHHRHRGHRFRALSIGATGHTVRYYQWLLGVARDGVFGPRTRAAVERVQWRHHMRVTGTVTRRTLVWMRHPPSRIRHAAGSPVGRRAVAIAKRQLGIRYTWGGSNRRTGFDCSGLVYYVYRHLGVRVPRVTYQQWHAGPHVPRGRLRPGDLVFFDHLGHVAIWVGHEWFIQAPHTGARVQDAIMRGWFRYHYDGAVRPS